MPPAKKDKVKMIRATFLNTLRFHLLSNNYDLNLTTTLQDMLIILPKTNIFPLLIIITSIPLIKQADNPLPVKAKKRQN
jgi:hypothetical protein